MNISPEDEQPKINEETLLRIKTLRKEYDIVLKQYQEAMKTYINDLSDENINNQYEECPFAFLNKSIKF